MSLTKKITTTQLVPVDSHIEDLVYFINYLYNRFGNDGLTLSQDKLIDAAEQFWDMQHGED